MLILIMKDMTNNIMYIVQEFDTSYNSLTNSYQH